MSELALHGGSPVRTDPPPQWPLHDDREVEAVTRVAKSGKWQYGLGKEGTELEEQFAEWIGSDYAISTINGTETMTLSLKAAGVGPGDEVIMPTTTFIACPLSVLLAGAVVIPVDIDPSNLSIDPAAVEAALTTQTKAIMPVHLAGIPADLDAIIDIANRHELMVLEDTAQAQGSEWKGKKVGTIGHFGSYSFQTSKTMVSGDGGIITTNDKSLNDLCRSYRQFGLPQKDGDHACGVAGGNYRISEFVAAVLKVQLSRVDELIDRRTENARTLTRKLGDVPGLHPFTLDERITRCSYLSYSIRYESEELEGVHRDTFLKALATEGISMRTGYTTLVHEMPLCNGENLRPEDLKRFSGRNIDAATNGHYPNAEHARDNTTIWAVQNWLLGDMDVTEDVVRAVYKVVENIGSLKS